MIENNMNHINSLEALNREKILVRKRLERHKDALSLKLYEIPAELAAAGANTLIPGFLKGRVTNAALSGGKKLINRFIVPEEKSNSALPSVMKGISLVRGIKKAISLWRGK